MLASMTKHLATSPSNGLASRAFWRATTAQILSRLTKEPADAILQRNWKTDEAARLICKSTSAPATTTTTGWADALATWAIAPLPLIAPASAAARLSAAVLELQFQRANQIVIPKIVTAPVAKWVVEGSPFPVAQANLGAVAFGPLKKLMLGASVSREISEYSPVTALGVIKRCVIDACTLALDT